MFLGQGRAGSLSLAGRVTESDGPPRRRGAVLRCAESRQRDSGGNEETDTSEAQEAHGQARHKVRGPGDTATLPKTLEAAEANLAAVGAAPTPEDPAELVADKGYHS